MGKVRFSMRKSSISLVLVGVGILLLGLMFMHATVQRQSDVAHIDQMARMVRTLGLTDLCLFTEARYARHPSQADLYSAFQDHPVSLEHFPTGSIVGPPAALRRLNGKLD
jgi:Tfp pilus assembly protein PilV